MGRLSPSYVFQAILLLQSVGSIKTYMQPNLMWAKPDMYICKECITVNNVYIILYIYTFTIFTRVSLSYLLLFSILREVEIYFVNFTPLLNSVDIFFINPIELSTVFAYFTKQLLTVVIKIEKIE